MDRETAREERRIATEKAVQALAERRRQARQNDVGTPALGETFLFRRAADHPVEWLVVEERPDDGRRLCVPIDDFPFIGSWDVELAANGSMTARCDLGVWLGTESFEGEPRTGALSAADLERVLAKRRVMLDRDPSIAEREVDEDPEYRQWHEETLRAAIQALSEAPVEKEERRAESLLRRWAVPLALAASAVFAVKLADLQETRGLREALRDEQQRADQYQARLVELEEALATEPQVNLPHFELQAENRVRGTTYTVVLPPPARRLALALEVRTPDYYERYRLRIVERGGGVVWETDQLVKDGRWLRLDLPSAFFAAGKEYDLRIEGLTGGSGKELEERYTIEIRSR